MAHMLSAVVHRWLFEPAATAPTDWGCAIVSSASLDVSSFSSSTHQLFGDLKTAVCPAIDLAQFLHEGARTQSTHELTVSPAVLSAFNLGADTFTGDARSRVRLVMIWLHALTLMTRVRHAARSLRMIDACVYVLAVVAVKQSLLCAIGSNANSGSMELRPDRTCISYQL